MTYEIIALSPRTLDLTGQTFGRLTAIAPVERNKWGSIKWLCVCACGNEPRIVATALNKGMSKSCGCRRVEANKKTSLSKKTLSWFMTGVCKTESCWNWNKAKNSDGYGSIGRSVNGVPESISAHRESWVLHNGEIPDGMHVLHKCDNPSCVNPDHLWLGTHQDNMADRNSKGRTSRMLGDKNPATKLNEVRVKIIRSAHPMVSGRELARRFNVTPALIYAIKSRKIWKHV